MKKIVTNDLRLLLYSTMRQIERDSRLKYYAFYDGNEESVDLIYNSNLFAIVTLMKQATRIRNIVDEKRKVTIDINNGIVFTINRISNHRYYVDSPYVILNFILLNMVDDTEKITIKYGEEKVNNITVPMKKEHPFFMNEMSSKLYEHVGKISKNIVEEGANYSQISISNGRENFVFAIKDM